MKSHITSRRRPRRAVYYTYAINVVPNTDLSASIWEREALR